MHSEVKQLEGASPKRRNKSHHIQMLAIFRQTGLVILCLRPTHLANLAVFFVLPAMLATWASITSASFIYNNCCRPWQKHSACLPLHWRDLTFPPQYPLSDFSAVVSPFRLRVVHTECLHRQRAYNGTSYQGPQAEDFCPPSNAMAISPAYAESTFLVICL